MQTPRIVEKHIPKILHQLLGTYLFLSMNLKQQFGEIYVMCIHQTWVMQAAQEGSIALRWLRWHLLRNTCRITGKEERKLAGVSEDWSSYRSAWPGLRTSFRECWEGEGRKASF